MKKINFLAKLAKEKKLGLVDPSEEIKESYIMKSESNLVSAKILLENNRLEEAVSLAYYSMYNLLTALLYKTGIKCENHSASILLLKELFSFENEEISHAKSERVDKQYYADFKITREEVIIAVKIAEKFNSHLIDFIAKINKPGISDYQKKFIKLVS